MQRRRASGREGNIAIPQMTCSCNRRLCVASPSWLIPISPVDFPYWDLMGLMIIRTVCFYIFLCKKDIESIEQNLLFPCSYTLVEWIHKLALDYGNITFTSLFDENEIHVGKRFAQAKAECGPLGLPIPRKCVRSEAKILLLEQVLWFEPFHVTPSSAVPDARRVSKHDWFYRSQIHVVVCIPCHHDNSLRQKNVL